MTDIQKIQWCISQHQKTNHFYDNYLPYEFHLRMVVQACKKFIHIPERQWSELEIACWGHDLIEDTRVSYNDCKEILGEYVANIIYAVTNEKGKTRKERANGNYYAGIVNTEGALFVKLCDRIANVQYSKMTGSKMFEMYKKENPEFIYYLSPMPKMYNEMVEYLQSLINPLSIISF